jgi:ABC-type sugar transport system permease subunit
MTAIPTLRAHRRLVRSRPSNRTIADRAPLAGVVVFLAPFILFYGAFTAWPLVATVIYSFFDWDGAGPMKDYVGLQNYLEIATDPLFWQSFRNTLIFVVVQTALKIPLSFVLAVVLTRRFLWFKRIFRAAFITPLIIPSSLVGLIIPFLLDPISGPITTALRDLGIISPDFAFLTTGGNALAVIIVVEVWQMAGQYMLFWMVALQDVPEELYEVAATDGVGAVRQHLHITLPMIRPAALLILLLGVVNAFQTFGIIVTLTGGGPGTSTYTVPYFIYVMAFQSIPFRYGYASAAALLFSVLAIILVGSQAAVGRKATQARSAHELD